MNGTTIVGFFNGVVITLHKIIPMSGTEIDVHSGGEFNAPDDTNKRVVGIPHCVISQITCEQLVSRAVRFQIFYQLIKKDDFNNCSFKIRVKDPFKPTEKRKGVKVDPIIIVLIQNSS